MKIIIIFGMLSSSLLGYTQNISIDDRMINCDSAYTNLDLGLCTRYLADSLRNELKNIYDSIICEIDLDIKENQKSIENEIDKEYVKFAKLELKNNIYCKNTLIESHKHFMESIKFERNLIGALMEGGRERFIHENLREANLLEERINYLNTIFN